MGINVFPQPSSSQSKKTQTITTSGNWTVPNGVTSVDVTCIGAAAAIGGAGAVVKRTVDTSSLQGTNISVTVGASPNPGTNGSGGNTSFGSFITAGGGFAGDTSYGGMSGTRFDSSALIPQDSTLVPFLSRYGESANWQQTIVYNSGAGIYCTSGNPNTSASTGNVVYYTSSNGTSWTRRTVSFNDNSNFSQSQGLYSFNNRLFYVYRNNSSSSRYRTSSDGINWSTERFIGGGHLMSMAFSTTANKYFFLNLDSSTAQISIYEVTTGNVDGSNPTVALNYDGIGKALRSPLIGSANIVFAFANSGGNVSRYLFNGTTWTNTVDATWSDSLFPTSGAWDGSKITLVTNTGVIYTTTNGTSYTNTGTTVTGLFIQGYSGGYYYGTINGQISYSTNGTTWTISNANVGSTYNINNLVSPNTYFANDTTVFISANSQKTGLLESFNMASPNTTVSKGFQGQGSLSTFSGFVNGGAGGIGTVARYLDGGGNLFSNYSVAPGIDNYGISIPIGTGTTIAGSLLNNTALSYGSTNGYLGTSGAVVLSWMQ